MGAGPLQVFLYAVSPQVRVAFTGIAIYTWDVAFRAATVVGFFGGGGMGFTSSAQCNLSRPNAWRRSCSPSSRSSRWPSSARAGCAAVSAIGGDSAAWNNGSNALGSQ